MMPLRPQQDEECDLLSAPVPYVVVNILLLIGLTVAYLLQVVRVVRLKTTHGLSPSALFWNLLFSISLLYHVIWSSTWPINAIRCIAWDSSSKLVAAGVTLRILPALLIFLNATACFACWAVLDSPLKRDSTLAQTEPSRQTSHSAMIPSGKLTTMTYLVGLSLYFVCIFLLLSIMELLRADPYWLNSTPGWSDQPNRATVLDWVLFALYQYHNIAILTLLLAALMMQASEINTFTTDIYETAIDVWAWGRESLVLVIIAISCMARLLSIAIFSPYVFQESLQLVLTQWLWNWLGYLLLGVGKGILLRIYVRHRRAMRDRRGRDEDGVEAPNETTGLLLDS